MPQQLSTYGNYQKCHLIDFHIVVVTCNSCHSCAKRSKSSKASKTAAGTTTRAADTLNPLWDSVVVLTCQDDDISF